MRHDESLFESKPIMSSSSIFLGIDCGATTSKIGGIDAKGELLSDKLRQSPTNSELGPVKIIEGWLGGANGFLESIDKTWDNVAGVGLAIPGPYLDYGILGKMPNMSAELEGWHFLKDLEEAIQEQAKRHIFTVTANDGILAGIPEAKLVQKVKKGSVLMFAPGSGLGCSFVNAEGQILQGDHQAGVIFAHMPAPFHLLDLPPFQCGCGRDWGCFEAYTSISGLPQLLDHYLPEYPKHPLAVSDRPTKEKVLSLRDLAQDKDPLALKIFETQAKALGFAVAAGCMAYDPTHIIIGGGLMDGESTTVEFRRTYLETVQKSAAEYSWVSPKKIHYHEAALGELSQAIGAALLARDKTNSG